MRDEVGDEVTLILGTGSNDTRHSVELTKMGAEAGADAGLIVTPYYNRPTQAGIMGHFEAIAEGSPGFPLVALQHPRPDRGEHAPGAAGRTRDRSTKSGP